MRLDLVAEWGLRNLLFGLYYIDVCFYVCGVWRYFYAGMSDRIDRGM